MRALNNIIMIERSKNFVDPKLCLTFLSNNSMNKTIWKVLSRINKTLIPQKANLSRMEEYIEY